MRVEEREEVVAPPLVVGPQAPDPSVEAGEPPAAQPEELREQDLREAGWILRREVDEIDEVRPEEGCGGEVAEAQAGGEDFGEAGRREFIARQWLTVKLKVWIYLSMRITRPSTSRERKDVGNGLVGSEGGALGRSYCRK